MAMTRILERALVALKQIAALTGESRQEILVRALEAYRHQRFLEWANVAYAALKADRQEWEAEQQERKVWGATLGDGLDE